MECSLYVLELISELINKTMAAKKKAAVKKAAVKQPKPVNPKGQAWETGKAIKLAKDESK